MTFGSNDDPNSFQESHKLQYPMKGRVIKMELLQLKYFCHAAESENFSKTAEHFDVPTSNISRAVRCLENELGIKLFNRSSNRLKLNYNGQIFLEHIRQSLSALDAGIAAVSEKDTVPRGELRVLLSSCRRIAT